MSFLSKLFFWRKPKIVIQQWNPSQEEIKDAAKVVDESIANYVPRSYGLAKAKATRVYEVPSTRGLGRDSAMDDVVTTVYSFAGSHDTSVGHSQTSYSHSDSSSSSSCDSSSSSDGGSSGGCD